MARWIAFDSQTSSLLRSKLQNSNWAQGTTVETFGRGAIDYALAKPGAVVTLLPAAGGIDVGIAVFRRPKQRIKTVALPPVRGVVRAGGFLGLSDESVVEEEPTEEKKAWWRRFWEE
jgi:hypothetical protein